MPRTKSLNKETKEEKEAKEVSSTPVSRPATRVEEMRENGESSVPPSETPGYLTEGAATETKRGILEIMPEGYGFLRANGLMPGSEDIYISQSQIRRFDIPASCWRVIRRVSPLPAR